MLTATTEHALRALVHMARLPEGNPILGRQLADRARIPANYLSKILLVLRNAGYVDTTRGQRGGYRLSKAPSQIRLIEIVELFEGTRCECECFLGEKHDCSDHNPCSAHATWGEVKRTYLNFLHSSTVAHLTRPCPWQNGQPVVSSVVGQAGKGVL